MITTRTTKAPIPWDGHASLPNGKQEKKIGGLLSASAMAEWVTPQSVGRKKSREERKSSPWARPCEAPTASAPTYPLITMKLRWMIVGCTFHCLVKSRTKGAYRRCQEIEPREG